MELGLLTAALFGAAAMAGFGAAAAVQRAERARPAPPGVAEVLSDLGLLLEAGRARGVVEGVVVRVVVDDHVTVSAPPVPGAGLRLDGDVAARGRYGWCTGDPQFDGVVRAVPEEPARAVALLDGHTREIVAEAVRLGARFDGRWEVRRAGSDEGLAAAVRAVARAHRALVSCLARGDVSLVERLHRDQSPGVRRQALAALLASNGATPARLRPCLQDVDLDVRLTAAQRLGEWPVLVEVARTASRSWRVRAARTLALVGASLDAEDAAVVRTVLEQALEDPAHAASAAEGLGAVGTVGSIAALTRAERGGSVRVRAAATRALAKLRGRLGDITGALSLADGEGGELSEPG
ncbi:MAG: hypothetical protein R3F59_29295 [Myxococcota bacterium]